MPIGTSLGAYFPNEMEFQKQFSSEDNNIIIPETTPDLDSQDNNSIPSPPPQANVFQASDIEDRRNEGIVKGVAGGLAATIGSPIANFLHPRPNPEPDKSGMAKDLGIDDIKIEHQPDVLYHSKYGDITSDDMDKAIKMGMAVSGGGLKTETESIASAALKFGNQLYEGINHGDALDQILKEHGHDITFNKIKDGFTTSKGRFVSREEAYDIAKNSHQIDPANLPNPVEGSSPMLLTEDMQ